MLLRFEGFVGAVVGGRRADDAQTRLDQVATFGEDEKLAEERNGDQFAVQFGRHARHFREALAVEQPEPAGVHQSQQRPKI